MWRIDSSNMWSLGKMPFRVISGFDGNTRLAQWLNERLTHHRGYTIRPPWDHHSLHTLIQDGPTDESDVTWHQDGTNGRPHTYLGIWSNHHSTEIRPLGSKNDVYVGVPGEFLLFDNDEFEHKVPDITLDEANTRWFVRIHTNGAVRRHNDVRQCTL